jgi:hypothetical protein
MSTTIVKIIARADGLRRVLIEKGSDGLFRFSEQARRDIPLEMPFDGDRQRWAPLGRNGTICETATLAEREAKAAIGWLMAREAPP